MMAIIPAMDLMGGRCVRLQQGDFSMKTVYGSDPVETARQFRDAGLRRLHLVDLDGAREGRPRNLDVLRRIRAATDLEIDYSGGLRNDGHLAAAFDAGADLVAIGSVAVTEPGRLASWIQRYGADRFIVAADVRGVHLAVNGWTRESEWELLPFLASMSELGIRNLLCTDIAQDGMLAGPATALYSTIRSMHPELNLIASGGVRNLADLEALDRIGCSSAIVGKALYEGRISLEDLSNRLSVL